jgi:glycosyltransferase involved in cell wall biosynthesis
MLILILWKKLLRYDFRICADWHMFFDNRLNRFVVRRVDHSITTSVKLKNFIIDKSGVRPESVSVVYGGTAIAGQADKDKTALREALGLPAEKKLVGYVGLFTTMGMEKGLDTMIKSLPLLDESYVMVLVGARGNEAEKYLKLADELGVRDRCVIVRMKREIEAVYDYQRAMDVLAIPYPDKAHFRDYGFPMKVYDYMAARRPIIYSKLEMAEEVIADYGCSFKPDDPADFARALESIFADYHAAQMKADRAHQAVKEFSWEKKCEKIIKFVSIN